MTGRGSSARDVPQAIRNLAAHDISGTEEAEALEQLAALSLLARWVDGASVQELPGATGRARSLRLLPKRPGSQRRTGSRAR
jgi:hypothetical protein